MRIFVITAITVVLTGIAPLHGSDWVFTGSAPGRHRGPVTAVIHTSTIILSAGEDGFIEKWNARNGSPLERFQVSPHRISAMAERPDSNEICIVESDDLGSWRISAWDYQERTRLFTVQLQDHISHISYSAGGNIIIAARTGRTGLIMFDASSGTEIQAPAALTGTVGLAVTGRSERNMVVYQPSGSLSYWDLETSGQTNRFNVPQNLFSPVLFSNNRFLAGLNAQGLSIVSAVSGELIAVDNSIPDGSLLLGINDDLLCLVQRPDASIELYRFTIDRSGRLVSQGHSNLFVSGPASDIRITSIAFNSTAPASSALALGTVDGSVITAGMNGRGRLLSAADQLHIVDADVSGSTIAFIAENGMIGYIPLNFNQLNPRMRIHTEQNDIPFSNITAFTGEDGSTGQFIFWQDRNIRIMPMIRSSNPGEEAQILESITLQSPLRSAASYGGKVLFLDSAGNITVIDPPAGDAGGPAFTFFSVGLMDAAFIDPNQLIIGRSVVADNSPFLLINISTGETVPLPYPSQAAVTLHRGTSDIYAVVISPRQETGSTQTFILQLNLANIHESVRLYDFEGEDTAFSLVQTADGFAATIGGEGAAIYASGVSLQLDRTAGFPSKLINGGAEANGRYLINLDKDGTIAWHDSLSGRLLAVFRLHPNGWSLQTERRTINGGY